MTLKVGDRVTHKFPARGHKGRLGVIVSIHNTEAVVLWDGTVGNLEVATVTLLGNLASSRYY